ncbi:hypothetical protein N7481_006007 [Penicillium waksmanii]|uniref:uncharacterized protein n=1 Tax=Penicillium waksmanii TaxID=69791 RepID=UPI00254886B5|nr:uncharacterized protein N7481_006007 [Penicillium waksmanii]KAJ5983908.1 hypothetical protein N7481_006007 [Penicillium waksmanii]
MPNLNYNPETEIPDLSGKTIFITGGTNGLGAESAFHLAKHNAAHIFISGRNSKSADKVIQRIRESGSNTEITFIECDLASLSSVKKTGEAFVSQTSRLDILLCNAGIMAQPPSLTTDGMTSLLGGSWRRYGQSKLANLLYARELARRYPGIISASIHPGIVSTGLVGNQKFLTRALIYATTFGKLLKPEEGAYNQVWAATTAKGNIENDLASSIQEIGIDYSEEKRQALPIGLGQESPRMVTQPATPLKGPLRKQNTLVGLFWRKKVDVNKLDLRKSYVGLVQPFKQVKSPRKRKEKRKTWNHISTTITDPKMIPEGWDHQEDLDPDDSDAQIARCQERIAERILPDVFQHRLDGFLELDAAEK